MIKIQNSTLSGNLLEDTKFNLQDYKFLFKIMHVFSKQHAENNIDIIKNTALKEFIKLSEKIFRLRTFIGKVMSKDVSCKFMLVFAVNNCI